MDSDIVFRMPTEQISLRLPKELLALLDDLAKREVRTRTNLIEYILTNWLREHEPDSFDDDGNIIQ
jgi:metal-responsive CopG/Arc/MetJ family transcriptional regulator